MSRGELEKAIGWRFSKLPAEIYFMNIVKLTSENVKRLTAVEITPQGNVCVIGGANGAGKSSVIDSILYALGGDPDVKMPVRRGEEKAKIVLDLGEIVVRRTFTAAGGTSLVVENADGAKQKSPQAILDALTGKLTFDPLDFARQKPEKQSETLRALVGLDFTESNQKYDALYLHRTNVNRDAKTLEVRLNSIPKHEGLPDGEVSSQDILAEQQKAQEGNQANQKIRDAHSNAVAELKVTNESRIPNALRQVTEAKAGVARMKEQLATAKKWLDDREAVLKKIQDAVPEIEKQLPLLKSAADAATDTDLSTFQTKLQSTEETNRKIRESKSRADLVTQFKSKTQEADKLTSQMDALESAKRKATTEAKYPVAGLLFDTAGGIALNGIPFSQCSSAEQLKVSVAIGFALNPKLSVVLIRDGSLLDDESMTTLCAMAKEAKAQVWVERVGTDTHTSVIIEDGHVKEVVA